MRDGIKYLKDLIKHLIKMSNLKITIKTSQWIELFGEILYIICSLIYITDSVVSYDEVSYYYLIASLFFFIAAIFMIVHSIYLICAINNS